MSMWARHPWPGGCWHSFRAGRIVAATMDVLGFEPGSRIIWVGLDDQRRNVVLETTTSQEATP